jgi:hypothetical protein
VDDTELQVTGTYTRRDRITAALIGLAMIGAAILMADIATDGRLSRPFGGAAAEAERYTREAVA